MKVAVLGAGGKAGKELVKELVSRGHQVVAIGRTAEKLPSGEGIETQVADLSEPAALAKSVAGSDAVISALTFQVPAATIIDGLKQGGVNRLIVTGGVAPPAALATAPWAVFFHVAGFLAGFSLTLMALARISALEPAAQRGFSESLISTRSPFGASLMRPSEFLEGADPLSAARDAGVIEKLKPNRIGHGIRAAYDEAANSILTPAVFDARVDAIYNGLVSEGIAAKHHSDHGR